MDADLVEAQFLYTTESTLQPLRPKIGLRIRTDERPGVLSALAGSTPDQAFGHWPDPNWRLGQLTGLRASTSDATWQHRIEFHGATIVGVEPPWRWFGPHGQIIESMLQATLGLSPERLARATLSGQPPRQWVDPLADDDPLRMPADNIRAAVRHGLTTKAQAEAPQYGGEVALGGGCVFVWEHTDPGWDRAEELTAAAMLAGLLDDRLDPVDRQHRLSGWHELVGGVR